MRDGLLVDTDALFDLDLSDIDGNLRHIYDGGGCGRYPMMLDARLPFPDAPPAGDTIVFDIGGTNFRGGVVRFGASGAAVEDFASKSARGCMSDFGCFISLLASWVIELSRGARSARVRICFSYPFVSTEDHDARIISMTKDIRMEGAEGKLLGSSLRSALLAEGVRADIAVINDASAAVLYARSAFPGADIRSSLFYGVIIGTGNNMALARERDGAVGVVNTELGQTQVGGGRALEHFTGGGYICRLVNSALAGSGVKFADTAEVSKFLAAGGASADIRGAVRKIVVRIACLEAKVLDKFIVFQKEVEGKRDACVNVEGTCYYGLPGYREGFEDAMRKLGVRGGYSVSFASPRDNSIMVATASAF